MSRYYVNKNIQNNGDHEVHTTGCSWLPKVENRIYLGDLTIAKMPLQKQKNSIHK